MTPTEARALWEAAAPHWDGCVLEVRQLLGDPGSNDARVAQPGPVRDLALAARDLARAYLGAEDRLAALEPERDDLDTIARAHGWDPDPTAVCWRGYVPCGPARYLHLRMEHLQLQLHHADVGAEDRVCHTCGGEGVVGHGSACSSCAGTGDGRRLLVLQQERDELRLTLLAEQGDPAGAPSEGWTARRGVLSGGAPGALSSFLWDHPTRGRVARAAGGQGWFWTGYRPGQTASAPTARETMRAADAASAEGDGR